MIRRREFLRVAATGSLLASMPSFGQTVAADLVQATIEIDLDNRIGPISPNIYGQFIEHLGRCIQGGIYEEASRLSNSDGFRLDVLEKVKRLAPPILRYPGGTVTKIYHWEDGVGPQKKRPRRPNLIWGGEEDNHFGTNEFIRYCRSIGAEPFLVVNMATGTAQEAANWVEYCNGTGKTYYAELRREHGFAEPHRVQFWGLGNEEHGEADAGRLQEPEAYVKEAWLFTKLMKLHDRSIKLIMAGHDETWNHKILRELHPVCDFLSAHFYHQSSQPLFEDIAAFDLRLRKAKSLLGTVPEKVQGFSRWYRFPPRQRPVQLAIDEWGLWEDGGKGAYDLELTYSWKHALATASFLNLFHRHADIIGIATWAQMVNVLAPIMTSEKGSICQTVFYPLEFYRKHCGAWSLKAHVESPPLDPHRKDSLPALDTSASCDETNKTLTLCVVNRHQSNAISTRIQVVRGSSPVLKRVYQLTSSSLEASNTIDRPNQDVVTVEMKSEAADNGLQVFGPRSVVICQYEL